MIPEGGWLCIRELLMVVLIGLLATSVYYLENDTCSNTPGILVPVAEALAIAGQFSMSIVNSFRLALQGSVLAKEPEDFRQHSETGSMARKSHARFA